MLRLKGGSRLFFDGVKDFHAGDSDFVEIDDSATCMRVVSVNKVSVFTWPRLTADEFVEFVSTIGQCFDFASCLNPEFSKELGIDISHLKEIRKSLKPQKEKHSYLVMILDFYIENEDFFLTEEQRMAAYKEYKSKRK